MGILNTLNDYGLFFQIVVGYVLQILMSQWYFAACGPCFWHVFHTFNWLSNMRNVIAGVHFSGHRVWAVVSSQREEEQHRRSPFKGNTNCNILRVLTIIPLCQHRGLKSSCFLQQTHLQYMKNYKTEKLINFPFTSLVCITTHYTDWFGCYVSTQF